MSVVFKNYANRRKYYFSQILMNKQRCLIFLLLTTILAGCGQIGPLYLPDASHPDKKPTQQ
jgi:hypothetical protein